LVVMVAAACTAAGSLPSRSARQPAPPASASPSATPTASPQHRAMTAVDCPLTRPNPPFVASRPYPRTPPKYYKSAWFGSAALWTMLNRDGEVWRHLPHDTAGFSQKTFWWSLGYSSAKEPEPAIVVTGKRLDAVGSFNAGDPGTNAT